MSSKNSIGNMILKMREAQGISQKTLCEGICSQKMMSRYETWTNIPDRLSLNLILQRLGKSPSRFVTMITQKEYQYFQWKKAVLEAMKAEDVKELRRLLAEPEAFDRSCHEGLQEQFYLYVSGYIEKDTDRMRTAIRITVPQYNGGIEKNICISTIEMNMILLYLQMREKTEETRRELETCIRYIENHFEEEELLKVYPGAVCLYSGFLENEKYERIVYCKKAISLLTRNGRIQELPLLLEILAGDLEQTDPKEAEHCQRQLQAFQEIYREQGMEIRKGGMLLEDIYQEVFVLSEVLKTYRKEKGHSRESVSDGICDVLSYGRVESGSRGINKSNYEKIAKRLGIPYGKYSAALITDDYDCLVLSRKVERAGKLQKLDEMEHCLAELKAKLDLSEAINQQYILTEENSLRFRMKEESVEEFRDNAIRALKITIPEWNEGYGTHFYSKTELMIVNQIAISDIELGENEAAIRIMERIWGEIDQSEMEISTRVEELLLMLTTWKDSLSAMGKYKESIEMSDAGVRLALTSERGEKLDTFLLEKEWAGTRLPEEERSTKQKRLQYCLQAFYMSEIFQRKENQRVLKKYLKDNYEMEVSYSYS